MPSFDVTPELILISLVIGQSLFFGAYILAARHHNPANVFLAGFMFVFAFVQIGEFFLEFSSRPEIKFYTLPFDALLAPLMYLYARRLTSSPSDEPDKRELLHLTSFFIALALITPWISLPSDLKNLPILIDSGVFGVVEGSLWPGAADQTVFSLETAPLHLTVAALSALSFVGLYQIQMTAYVAALILVFWRHRDRIRQNFSDLDEVKLRWLGFLCLACLGMWLSVVPFEAASAAFPIGEIGELIQETAQLAIIYCLGFQGMRQPVIYACDASWATAPSARQSQTVGELAPQSRREPAKYARSGLSDEQMARIAAKLQRTMRADCHFLDSSLTLPQLANTTNISVNHISQVLNVHLGLNFFDFVNGFRIEAAKAHLLGSDMTILDVAFASGFNAKSTFNTAFKKATGETPGQYRTRSLAGALAASEA
jgi:AraC-like DNA-binding protein